jgi:hypothetical protein
MIFIGKIAGINTSDGKLNLLVLDKDKNQMNLKVKDGASLELGKVYAFEYDEEKGQLYFHMYL